MYVFLCLFALCLVGLPYYLAAEAAGRSGVRYFGVGWGLFLVMLILPYPVVYLLLVVHLVSGFRFSFPDEIVDFLLSGSGPLVLSLALTWGFLGVLWWRWGAKRAGDLR